MNVTKNLKATDFELKENKLCISQKLMNNKFGLLLVHAKWCGYCVRFKPTYEEIHKLLNKNFNCMALEDVELEKNNLNKYLKIVSYPTLLWVDKKGNIIGRYEGNRDKSVLLREICKKFHSCV